MFCRRCGAQIPDDSTFCTRCGAPVAFTGASTNPPTGSESFSPTLPGEQFMPPPAWQAQPPSGWASPAGPGPYRPPSPPQPPLWEQVFGPRSQPGAPLNHRSRVQRSLFSRLPPSVASSAWFGAIIGALAACAVVLLLSVAFSLTLGPTLDQGSTNTANALGTTLSTGQTGQDTSTTTANISLYSNPLLFLASANQSRIVEKITLNSAADSSDPASFQLDLSGTISAASPPTLLLLIPAIGLIIGGYLAAATDYSGRRLFSITRGASLCIFYAALMLILSLFGTGSLALNSSADSLTTSYSGTITADAFSVFLNALLWGAIFGALGGYLRARSLPRMPHSRLYERIRGAFIGAGTVLGISFVLCLLVIIILYTAGQLFTASLLSQSASASTPASSLCGALTRVIGPSTPTPASPDSSTYLSFIVSSPGLALWLMALSMGAPLQISGAANLSIGLFGADCQLGSGGIMYLFLLIPAVAVFFGGWTAARVARPRSAQEAAGLGLLLAAALAILLLIVTLLASATINEAITINITGGSGTPEVPVTGSDSLDEGPAPGFVIIASLIFGGIFGILGGLVGRPRSLPPLPHSIPSAWPVAPAAWPQAPQGSTQPAVSSAVASYPPASAGPALAVLGDQLTIVTSDLPQMPAAPDTNGEAAGPEDPTPHTP